MSIISYFTDPVLRAPTLGSMLMCLSASLVGVILYLRKQSLLGETLSHASYPGVILGVIFSGLFFRKAEGLALSIFILIGAFVTALFGIWCIEILVRRFRVKPDSALCFTLASFFGIGITLASHVQFVHTTLYKQATVYLYGQAATMTDLHIYIYAILACFVISVLILFYKELKCITFDKDYAKSLGIKVQLIDQLFFLLVVLAVVIGIRSVGVVLMSAMFIAPAAAARQYTDSFSKMCLLSALFGLLSGYLGNIFSFELSKSFSSYDNSIHLTFPTGPMIVLVAAFFCFFSLLFAPKKGLILRILRIANFRYKCICENILKAFWRKDPEKSISFKEISSTQNVSTLYLSFILWRLVQNRWLEKISRCTYMLTKDGQIRAAKIVRLHRLWELYLVDYLGIGAEKVHRNAEEMEHILNPELEVKLTALLHDPKEDPHHQPIPPKEEL